MSIFNRFYLVNNQMGAGHLAQQGPTFPVEIHVPSGLAQVMTQAGQPLPRPVSGMALFDTGASVTCVDASVITSLGVQPVGQGKVHTPSGEANQSIFPARLSFPTMNFSMDFNAVFGANLAPQGIIALIGRDVLSNAVFTYNGPGGFVTLSF